MTLMSAILPIDPAALLRARGVESERLELKASWDPRTTGPQVLRTICAFANDYHNLNGGYVVIGVRERDGCAVLPPAGLSPVEVEAARKWIRGHCRRLDPPYQPVLSPEVVEGRNVLIAWAPASQVRPHRGPSGARGERRYWVRLGSETVDAEQRGDLLRRLVEQTARVPWDDRGAFGAGLADVREMSVREHLHEIGSGLAGHPDATEVYRRMRITTRANDHDVPRNVGLLFFSDDATRWFPGAWIDAALFSADGAGDVQEERAFRGGLTAQVRNCLRHLQGLSPAHVRKEPDRYQARRWVLYPETAVRETLVNAVYHRGYGPDVPEPTKVYLYPDRMEIVSYPGPVPGIAPEHFTPDAAFPPAPARNRRIGEFLKELGLAEARLTGLRKVFGAMRANGSPDPRFEFDEHRTWFRATLSAHPEYVAVSAVRDAAHLRALGDAEAGFRRLATVWMANPTSAVLAAEMVRWHTERGEPGEAKAIVETFRETGAGFEVREVAEVYARCGRSSGQDDPPI